jgi:uncharacterized LabA/DUF88 family protein
MRNKKEKVLIIFDGSNFYHILKNKRVAIRRTINFNYRKLAEWLADGREIVDIRYYVGVVRLEPKDQEKSQKVVSCQQKIFSALAKQRISVVRGYMMKSAGVYHEKGVDVRIAVDMVAGAVDHVFDTAVLVSSDTDLIPAVENVTKKRKKVEYIGLSYRPSFGLIKKATETRLLTKKDLDRFKE